MYWEVFWLQHNGVIQNKQEGKRVVDWWHNLLQGAGGDSHV